MENLKLLRKQNKLKQDEVASTLSIARSTYQSYEYGVAEPDVRTLIKLADFFQVSLDYLCGRQNNNTIFVDSLTEEQKKIVSLVRGLTHDQSLLVLGYLSNMLKLPYEEVRTTRPF